MNNKIQRLPKVYSYSNDTSKFSVMCRKQAFPSAEERFHSFPSAKPLGDTEII
jgi:hypothetical protein